MPGLLRMGCLQIVLEPKNGLGHFGSRFGSEIVRGILGHNIFDGCERMPEQPLVHPLIQVVVVPLRIRDVADREFGRLLKDAVIVSRPRVERAAVVDLCQLVLGLRSYIHESHFGGK